ncbi:hypothetical protein PHYBOEH_002726 [Phytophthora boehmeriae]|uniref:Mediator complex subunit 15 KIX domain-containing protein n=1 Tax=Phytophthora boehmeriae TaxID=109152 RepID=A0A8T1XA48_9STRA|nr:hypothetical protein PHYBOEH_002726 [Phytophthora boehmeriae]
MRPEAVDAPGSTAGDCPAAAPSEAPAVAPVCASDSTGAESPATPMEVALATQPPNTQNTSGDNDKRQGKPMTADQITQQQNEQRRERQWRRMVHSELRDRLVTGMMQELQRITGDKDARHLRMCASRYESFVWKKSANQVQYKQKLERRIESLRRQPSQAESANVTGEDPRLNLVRSLTSSPELRMDTADEVSVLGSCSFSSRHQQQQVEDVAASQVPPTARRRSSSRKNGSKRAGKRKMRTSSTSSTNSGVSAQRDEQYFTKLRVMKNKYRDEVALVFRELCRVNTVIQHSASLRRHESNNLGDFLANLKKIIYLLEQQPGEACGMIPARKRTVEYLDVVESHIQRKVLPILHRLRHTYSSILRPIVLNYMKNSYRFNRRF